MMPQKMTSFSNRTLPSSRSSSSRSSFCKSVTPMTLKQLQQHDEAIAAITRSNHSINLDASYKSFNGSNSFHTDDVSENSHPAPVREESLSSLTLNSSDAAPTRVSAVRREDLRRINLIGNGRFCKVHLASGPSRLLSNNRKDNDDRYNKTRRQPPTMVAVKAIDPAKIQQPFELALAAGELANEATILSALDHENIIQLRGVCNESFSGSFGLFNDGYFLVFAVLRETLADRLKKWKRQKDKKEKIYRKNSRGYGRPKSIWKRLLPSSCHAKRLLSTSTNTVVTHLTEMEPEADERKRRMYHRIEETVMGIAKGLKYLHSKNIVLRDLKPANIGYEDPPVIQYGHSVSDGLNLSRHSSGNSVRLFDFGLASYVEDCDPNEACGSLRYMAPEAMNGCGYSLKVDVYSFGVVLFEICSLCHPFENDIHKLGCFNKKNKSQKPETNVGEDQLVEDFTEQFLAGKVALSSDMNRQVRCPRMRSLIEDCTSWNPELRPGFEEIVARLNAIFSKRDGSVATTLTPRTSNPSEVFIHSPMLPEREPAPLLAA